MIEEILKENKVGNDIYYVKVLTQILEDEFNMSIDLLKKNISSSKVTLKEKEIKEYLFEKFKIEHPDVLERNQKREEFYDPLNNISKVSPEDVKHFEDFIASPKITFSDSLITEQYRYDSETYRFYSESIDILKKKALLLISIIEGIGSDDINDILVDLDIVLNEFNNIKYEDIIRLLKPTIDVINDLYEKLKLANDFDTYMNIKMSKKSLAETGISYEERRIGPELQLKNIEQDNLNFKGYIPLSSNQRKNIEKEDERYLNEMTKVLTKVF